MVEKEVAITYETLYELLRREKSREELQELQESFLGNVIEYINDKKRIIGSKKGDPFSEDEAEKTTHQLRQARKLLKELYDRREKKIINMAINKARTESSIIDTSALLAEEQQIFENVTSVLNNHRQQIFEKVMCGQKAGSDTSLLSANNAELKKGMDAYANKKTANAHGASETPAAEENDEPTAGEQSIPFTITPPSGKPMAVVFTTMVPEFVGPDLEEYGPYSSGDSAELPAAIAELLIRNSQAIKQGQEMIAGDDEGHVPAREEQEFEQEFNEAAEIESTV